LVADISSMRNMLTRKIRRLLHHLPTIAVSIFLLATSSTAQDWPPHDSGEGHVAVEINTAWARQLRGLATFTDLQRVAGAKGRLESVEASASPRALYSWTGMEGKGMMRVFRYQSDAFGAVVSPSDMAGDIVINGFGAFVCPACSPPVNACGGRPSWVPHEVHWDTFDCHLTLTGPQGPGPGG
jgi:hypothetical protein